MRSEKNVLPNAVTTLFSGKLLSGRRFSECKRLVIELNDYPETSENVKKISMKLKNNLAFAKCILIKSLFMCWENTKLL